VDWTPEVMISEERMGRKW